MKRIAVISVHGCPVIQAGLKDAGGMNIYVLETARALSRCGIQVDIFTRHHDPLDPMIVHLTPGARAIHLPAGPPSTEKVGVYDLLPEFTRQVVSYADRWNLDYDLVVSHYWLSGLVGIDLSERWEVPHSTSFHTLAAVKQQVAPDDFEHPNRNEAELEIARTVDMVIVWTEHERKILVDQYGARPERVKVIPPGVDQDRFSPVCQADARAELGLNGEKMVLYVGRLDRLKGVDTLINAMTRLEHTDGLRLYVAGGSRGTPEMCWLESVATELGVHDRVEFLGSVPQDRLKTYYNAADICVLPSRYESFGLAALEAAACGKPVVASRVGGLPAIVLDGVTGFLVDWQCPGNFVERLDLLLNNESLRRSMGDAARRHAQTLDWESTAGQLMETYMSLLPDAPFSLPGAGAALQPTV